MSRHALSPTACWLFELWPKVHNWCITTAYEVHNPLNCEGIVKTASQSPADNEGRRDGAWSAGTELKADSHEIKHELFCRKTELFSWSASPNARHVPKRPHLAAGHGRPVSLGVLGRKSNQGPKEPPTGASTQPIPQDRPRTR